MNTLPLWRYVNRKLSSVPHDVLACKIDVMNSYKPCEPLGNLMLSQFSGTKEGRRSESDLVVINQTQGTVSKLN
jgi:hypothetical protein